MVPRITMTNAAGDHRPDRPAPLRMLPPISATSASTMPITLSLSIVRFASVEVFRLAFPLSRVREKGKQKANRVLRPS